MRLPPTFGDVAPAYDAYVSPSTLRALANEHPRSWRFHDLPTTVALPRNCYAKSLGPFEDHREETQFRELLREYADNGVPRPGGYADVFHEHFKSPKIPWSINAPFEKCFAGGWQEAFSVGRHIGTYYCYDMRSAYLWSLTRGLPDPRTYSRSLKPWRKGFHQGLYRVKLLEPCKGAPYPYNQCRECLATDHEIELYGMRVASVVDGVTWTGTIDTDDMVQQIMRVSTWKAAGRAYWGRWSQTSKVQCVSGEKKWFLPNLALNIPWAHVIVARVKERLWEFSKHALHVYVDSLITEEELPTGPNIGDWKCVRTYATGVTIRGPGQYGARDADKLERMAGVPRTSLQRSNHAVLH